MLWWRFSCISCMSCSCTKRTFIPHTKEGLNKLFPHHNSSSFQSNLMPGNFFFWLNACTKKYRKSRGLTVKGKPKDSLGARRFFLQGQRGRSAIPNQRSRKKKKTSGRTTLEPYFHAWRQLRFLVTVLYQLNNLCGYCCRSKTKSLLTS